MFSNMGNFEQGVLVGLPEVFSGDAPLRKKLLGVTDTAQLKTYQPLRLKSLTHGELGATSANINNKPA